MEHPTQFISFIGSFHFHIFGSTIFIGNCSYLLYCLGAIYTNVFYHSVSITNVYFECHATDNLLSNCDSRFHFIFQRFIVVFFELMSKFDKPLAIFYNKILTIIFIFTTVICVKKYKTVAHLLSPTIFK